jgi:excisionase family DNA binding protein
VSVSEPSTERGKLRMARATLPSVPASDRPLLTVKQTCERLTIGRSKLEDLFRAGKLTKLHHGPRSVRVSPEQVDHYIAQMHAQAATPVAEAVSGVFDANAQFNMTDSPFR